MGNQKMLVQLQADETRIALTEDDRLIDLHVEQTDRERTAGNIYFGVVVKVNPAFQAAFIDYGEKRNGFLSLNDVNQDLFKNGGDAAKGGAPENSVSPEGRPDDDGAGAERRDGRQRGFPDHFHQPAGSLSGHDAQ